MHQGLKTDKYVDWEGGRGLKGDKYVDKDKLLESFSGQTIISKECDRFYHLLIR